MCRNYITIFGLAIGWWQAKRKNAVQPLLMNHEEKRTKDTKTPCRSRHCGHASRLVSLVVKRFPVFPPKEVLPGRVTRRHATSCTSGVSGASFAWVTMSVMTLRTWSSAAT